MSETYEQIADKYTATTDPLLVLMTRSMFIAELETAVRNAIVQREALAQRTPPDLGPAELNKLATDAFSQAAARAQCGAPYRFRRYVNGVEMAEGVHISNAATVQEAFAEARRLYGRPAGMDLVLELIAPCTPPSSEPAVKMLWKLVQFYDAIDREHEDGEAKLLDEAAAVVAAASRTPAAAEPAQGATKPILDRDKKELLDLADLIDGSIANIHVGSRTLSSYLNSKIASAIRLAVSTHFPALPQAAPRTPAETDWQIMYEAETRISAKQAAEIVQLREDLEALRAAPTKEEVELRLEVVRLRKEADTAHAEVVHTQDELGALLHAAEAKLAQALSRVEGLTFRLHDILEADQVLSSVGVTSGTFRRHMADPLIAARELLDRSPEHPSTEQAVAEIIDWASRLKIVCHHPDGADRCSGCPHYQDPKRNPECSYATRHEHTPHVGHPGKVCGYHDGCPADGPVCHLCEHLQP
jgi:hypothetical protein